MLPRARGNVTRTKDSRKKSTTHGECLGVYRKTLELSRRAAWTSETLDALVSLTAELLADENFLTLLKAESLLVMPSYLALRVSKLRYHEN
jgi:hypothetical protein